MTNSVIFTNFSDIFSCMLFLNEQNIVEVPSDFGAKSDFVNLEGQVKVGQKRERQQRKNYTFTL